MDAGHTRYTQLACDVLRSTGLRVPNPQFPTKTPAGRRSSWPLVVLVLLARSAGRVDRSAVRQVRRNAGCGAGTGPDRRPDPSLASSPAWVVVAGPAPQLRCRTRWWS